MVGLRGCYCQFLKGLMGTVAAELPALNPTILPKKEDLDREMQNRDYKFCILLLHFGFIHSLVQFVCMCVSKVFICHF